MAALCIDLISMRHIPEDALRTIFTYLDNKNLLQIEIVCKSWRKLCEQYDETLWLSLSEQLWNKYFFNRPSDMNVLSRIKELPLSSLKKCLRNTDLARCLEKKDYQRMLLAKLVFYHPAYRELSLEDPRYKGRYLHMYYPDWSLSMGIYKMSFDYHQRELQRTSITGHELCTIHWNFTCKGQGYNPHNDGDNVTDDSSSYIRRFYVNGTCDSHDPNVYYRWRFVEVKEDGGTNSQFIQKIQVEHFPTITSYRLPKDGRWCLENSHVIMKQQKNLVSNEEIVLHIPDDIV